MPASAVSLREQITADMKEAMRARDTTRLEAVRLLRAAIQRREVDEQIELVDDEILTVIQKLIKQGRDSIEQFKKGNRRDLVKKETTMVTMLETYRPASLSEEELVALISEAFDETNAQSIRDMGQVMAWLKPKLQGRANMANVSTAVRDRLNR